MILIQLVVRAAKGKFIVSLSLGTRPSHAEEEEGLVNLHT